MVWSGPPTLKEIIAEIEDEQRRLQKRGMKRIRKRMAKILGVDPIEYLEEAKKKDFQNARKGLMDVIVALFIAVKRKN